MESSSAPRSSADASRNQSRKSAKRERAQEWHADTRDVATLHNASWEKYYRGTIVPEEEWANFLASMQTGLPVSIRITPRHSSLFSYLPEQMRETSEVKPIPFVLPHGSAFQCGVSRGDVKRKAEHKAVKKLLSTLNDGGYLTRQEAVSMLPPILLGVEPGHRVLDMCAAPGSKTSQILERMLLTDAVAAGGSQEADGVVVANDVNFSRIDVLHHQTGRLPGAHTHLIVTNYDARRFPLCVDRFDRVLCDVMCSGDGTLRKSVDMWPRWNTLVGADLHLSQCQVLKRGMALCKQGGVVVYSTCSLNPVEDEAVVSACLSAIELEGGKFELMEPDGMLPGLVYAKGLTSWSMLTRDLSTELRTMEVAQAYNASQQQQQGGGAKKKLFQFQASMFADTSLLEAQHIDRTRRVLPHQQDTGGFFVAALRCVEAVPWNTKRDGDAATAAKGLGACPLQPPSAELRAAAQSSLALPDGFPWDRVVARNETKREQKLYIAHPNAIALSQQLGSRVVSVGEKVCEAVFKYSLNKFRFSAEGLFTVKHWLITSPSATAQQWSLPVPLTLFIALSKVGGTMTVDEFCSASAIPSEVLQTLPPCFLVEGRLPSSLPPLLLGTEAEQPVPTTTLCEGGVSLGSLLVAVEKTSPTTVMYRVSEWQASLARVALGLPLVSVDPQPPAKVEKTEGEAAAS